jgi:hypothetical protein
MIESTALFFSLLALYFYWQSLQGDSRASVLLILRVALCASLLLALLTKATTALPVLLLIVVDQVRALWGRTSPGIKPPLRERLLAALPYLVILLISWLILKGWISHTDRLKSSNLLGAQLASTAPMMARWNYGSPMQGMSPDLWDTVVQQRMLSRMALLPVTILLLCGVQHSQPSDKKPRRYLIACFLGLAVAPLLLFPNLHIVHNYYQSANQIYLLLAITVATDALLSASPPWPLIAMICVATFSAVFVTDFRTTYLPATAITRSDQQEIGALLREKTNPDGVIYIEDDEYNSAIAFHAQRRALMYPDFAEKVISRTELLEKLPQFLDGRSLEAMVRRNKEIPAEDLAIACPGYKKQEMKMNAPWFVYTCH